jgi:hypothetical protein
MNHFRLGLSIGCACVAAHTAYVWHERQSLTPSGRSLQFSPGSQDDLKADSLRTGDLVVFSRDCVLYGPCGALACEARKRGPGGDGTYDHVGVVVLHHGVPHVLERTHSGAHLRRFSARVRCSRAREIFVRPLVPPLTPAQARAAAAAAAAELAPTPLEQHLQRWQQGTPAEAMAAAMASPAAATHALAEAGALLVGLQAANSSVALARRFYASVLQPEAGSAGGQAAQGSSSSSSGSDLTRLGALPVSKRHTAAAATGSQFGPPYWFRDLVN